ncbi:hypothetical protein [Streptomyces sp. NPDC021224]|uniref:hypothetical protein n=1 Tax=unclassified Streptomyces TaxID=2593676 RepID=UPI0037B7FA04
MTAHTFAEQLPAADALAQITATLGHLPAADINLSPVFPDHLTVAIHDDLGAFEQWRQALGVPATAIDYAAHRHHMTLRAATPFAGATIDLVAYAPALPTPGGAQ